MTTKNVSMENGDELLIKEFKLEMIAENAAIVMVAKRGSGKSFVCRTILQYFHRIPVGIVISPTDRMNCFYGNFFPDSFIHYEYKSEVIQKLLNRQDKMIEKKIQKKDDKKKIDTRSFILMDDCLSSRKTWMRDQPITELLFNGRHYDLMYILTMQTPLGITPEMRNQFDYIFLLAEDFQSNLKRIYEHYAGMFPTFDSFKQIFSKLTNDFGCMVIVNTNRGTHNQDSKELHKSKTKKMDTSFLDKIFWFKADDLLISKFGCDQFRKYHESNYDKEWRKKIKQFDANEYCLEKKKDKSAIKIRKI
jgi:hypothetical protein